MSPKSVKLENLAQNFICTTSTKLANNFPKKGRGLGYVTLKIWHTRIKYLAYPYSLRHFSKTNEATDF